MGGAWGELIIPFLPTVAAALPTSQLHGKIHGGGFHVLEWLESCACMHATHWCWLGIYLCLDVLSRGRRQTSTFTLFCKMSVTYISSPGNPFSLKCSVVRLACGHIQHKNALHHNRAQLGLAQSLVAHTSSTLLNRASVGVTPCAATGTQQAV